MDGKVHHIGYAITSFTLDANHNITCHFLMWLQALLARGIMKRVETDNTRNSRMPKLVTGGAWIGWTCCLPFLTDRDLDSHVHRLVDGTQKALTNGGHLSIIRIGFSVIDFVVRSKGGVDSFFSKEGRVQSQSTKQLIGNNGCKKEVHEKLVGLGSYISAKNNIPPATSNKRKRTQSPQYAIVAVNFFLLN